MKDPLENMEPTDHGWREINGVYLPVWFTGSQMTAVLSDTMQPEDVAEAEEDDNDDIHNFIDDESEDESDEDGE